LNKYSNGRLNIDEIIEFFGGEQSYCVKVIDYIDSNKEGEVDY